MSVDMTTFKKSQMAEFRKRLKFLRISKGLSGQGLAAKIGKTSSTISQIETGRQDPTFSVLFDLAEALNTPVWQLFTPLEVTI